MASLFSEHTNQPRVMRRPRKYRLGIVFLVCTAVVAATAATLIFSNRGSLRLVTTIQIDGSVTIAALSPDGKFVASADMSNLAIGTSRIRIASATDGTPISTTPPVSVYSLAFSPDGNLLAASGNDGLRLFRTSDGHLSRTIPGDQIFCVTFSSDGRLLAAAGAEGKIQIVQMQDVGIIKTLVLDRWITSVAFSPDGKLLAVGTSANTGLVRRDELSKQENPIFLFRISGSEPPSELRGHIYGVLTLAFSPDGRLLASGGSDGMIRLSEAATGRTINVVQSSTNHSPKQDRAVAVNHVGFDSKGKLFTAALANGTILFFESRNGKPETSVEAHTGAVLRTVFANGTSGFISVGTDSAVRLWELK